MTLLSDEVKDRLDAFVTRYPQYRRNAERCKLGFMQKTWRRNFFNYAERGDPVYFFRRPITAGTRYGSAAKDTEELVLFCVDSEGKEHWLVARLHFVKESRHAV